MNVKASGYPSVSDNEKPDRIKHSLRIARVIAFWGGIPSVYVYTRQYGNSAHPVGMVAWAFACGALIAFLVSSSIALHTQRRMLSGDVVRIACWMVVGSVLGLAWLVGNYYKAFYPQYGAVVNRLATMAFWGALFVIGLSLVLFPPPKAPKPGCCASCGYELKGLPEARCPECGQPFDPKLLAKQANASPQAEKGA